MTEGIVFFQVPSLAPKIPVSIWMPVIFVQYIKMIKAKAYALAFMFLYLQKIFSALFQSITLNQSLI